MQQSIRYAWGNSSLGRFIAASSERGLVMVEFADADALSVQALRLRFPDADLTEAPEAMAQTVAELSHLIDHPQLNSTLALDLRGSEFELRVWQALREIPPGQTLSYGAIAARLGAPGMAREVGAACAANTLAVIVPCHRVLKKDGSLSGYRWGVKRKRALLEQEARA
jgi:AraC family transcriptional regulator of adaptative response/methylated-DNA-[protein]-cysteine methyltransferase